MKDYIELEKQNFTIIGKNVTLQGPVSFEGVTHVCGSIFGNVDVSDQSLLTVESVGKIEGSVSCHELAVFGEVKGQIKASGVVRVYPSAKIEGKITAKNLIIRPGAKVNMEGHTLES